MNTTFDQRTWPGCIILLLLAKLVGVMQVYVNGQQIESNLKNTDIITASFLPEVLFLAKNVQASALNLKKER